MVSDDNLKNATTVATRTSYPTERETKKPYLRRFPLSERHPEYDCIRHRTARARRREIPAREGSVGKIQIGDPPLSHFPMRDWEHFHAQSYLYYFSLVVVMLLFSLPLLALHDPNSFANGEPGGIRPSTDDEALEPTPRENDLRARRSSSGVN